MLPSFIKRFCIISLFFLAFFSYKKVNAIEAFCDNCGAWASGGYKCEGGTMCCTGGGCPSYDCGECNTGGSEGTWKWNCDGESECKRCTCTVPLVYKCPQPDDCYWACNGDWQCTQKSCNQVTGKCDVYGNSCTCTSYCDAGECGGACVYCTPGDGSGGGGGGGTNQPPICDSFTGPTTINAGSPQSTYTYTVSAHDTDGSIASYTWSTNVGTFSTSPTTTSTNTLTAPLDAAAGTATVSVSIKDNSGASVSCSPLSVTVVPDFDLSLSARKLTGETQACNVSTTAISNASVTAISGLIATNSVTISPVGAKTDSNGNFSINNLNASYFQGSNSITACIHPPAAASCTSFISKCPSGVSSDGCVSGIDSTNATKKIEFYNPAQSKWITAVDGNIQSAGMGYSTPCNADVAVLGGFYSTAINFSSMPAGSAFAFTSGEASTLEKIIHFNLGGSAKNTNETDDYLNQLTFEYPSGVTGTSITSLNQITTPGIYYINATVFNSLDSAKSSYKLALGGMAILYVVNDFTTPGSTLNINYPITNTSNTNRNLLIITNLPVVVKNTVGNASPNITDAPQIQASIVTPQNITISSQYPTVDNALTILGPLVSLKSILFNRDLQAANVNYPSQIVKYNPYLLYYLTEMERNNPSIRTYTGLGERTVIWEYSN